MHDGLDMRLNIADDREHLLKCFLKLVQIKRKTDTHIDRELIGKPFNCLRKNNPL